MDPSDLLISLPLVRKCPVLGRLYDVLRVCPGEIVILYAVYYSELIFYPWIHTERKAGHIPRTTFRTKGYGKHINQSKSPGHSLLSEFLLIYEYTAYVRVYEKVKLSAPEGN
jgi:hypothetical protein